MLVTVLYYALIIKVMHLNALNCIMTTDVDTIHLLKNKKQFKMTIYNLNDVYWFLILCYLNLLYCFNAMLYL